MRRPRAHRWRACALVGWQMVCVFLAEMLPTVDARVEEVPCDNNLFDLIPASKLRLHDVRAAGSPVPGEPPAA